MSVAELVLESFKLMFPAYCANAMPVIAGGGLPLDLRRKFIDGKPVFGKNKTFRGFFAGLAIGTLIGLAESSFFGYHVLSGLMLSLGALLGDLFGAFVKRRLGIPPGGLLPVVDQVDFVGGAILFSLPVLSATWSWELVLVALLVTPPIHMLTNFVAYKLRLKSNPW
ncbi:MAG: CDP-2,3-bis-(O-geranylgeranyl)-sn-glycerol synthase [Candidatus Bathyarchaeota archaeon]|nr:CDP-2,3-bis-(O-geranylgeranyl)-sn-glycerol synthase [Candidatus Bathyarchaeota archaeon]